MSPMPHLLFLIAVLVCAGATNMVFVKTHGSARLRPIDGGVLLRDGKRMFGDNKTWKGFFGMIVITAIWLAIAVWLVSHVPAIKGLSPTAFEELRLPFNAWVSGALLGLAYVLAELPNSFLKRRIDIAPGKNATGLKGLIFLMLDQADSVIGCVIALLLLGSITGSDAVMLIVLGSLAHYLTNLGLYAVRLKKQAG